MELVAEAVHLKELTERFAVAVRNGGVDAALVEAVTIAAPPADDFATRLLELVPALDEPGRFAVAGLAVGLAVDPGYRPVVETVVTDHPLGSTYRPWLAMRGARLQGEALEWWLDLVAEQLPAGPIEYALYRRADLLGPRDRATVVAHLLRTDTGPARHAAQLAAEVLRSGGPCAPLEEMVCRWIREGRFDEDVPDTQDGGTSADVLAVCLERCVAHGPFTDRWAPMREAVEHWRALLTSGVPERRRRGLSCMATLLAFGTSAAGALPRGLVARADRRRPEWRVIERGFSAINTARRSPHQAAELDPVINECALDLAALVGP